MKVKVNSDEFYPCYFEIDDNDFGTVIGLTEEEYALFKEVSKKFFEVQRLIQKKVEEENEIRQKRRIQ